MCWVPEVRLGLGGGTLAVTVLRDEPERGRRPTAVGVPAATDDDDDDDDVQKKACRVLAERAKGEKFLGTFVRVHRNKIFMQQVV